MIQASCISCTWVRSRVEDTARVVGKTDSNVTFISPAWSPGVFDESVLLSVKGSVSDGEDTVVESGTTSRSDDSTGI